MARPADLDTAAKGRWRRQNPALLSDCADLVLVDRGNGCDQH